jgi:hypothetical protein
VTTVTALLLFLILSPSCLLAQPKLQVVEAAFHQFDGGPAIRGGVEFLTTETLFFTAKVSGFQKSAKEAIALEWTIETFDDDKVPLAPAETKPIEVELAEEDKGWLPLIRYQVELPQTATCNACRLKLTVRDKLANAQAVADLPFAIRGLRVEPAESITVQNFRFTRAENDPTPLAVAAFRPGDELWGRFEITGYVYGEKNRVQVEYGLSVFRPSGKLLYEEPKAAAADETSFYPRKYLPGMLNLKLDSLPPGEYPIVIEVRDLAAGKKHEHRVTFRVE